jgi:hypothetical protein
MLQYYCSVMLGGSLQHIVANKLVTIPEISLLRRAHGSDSVINLRSAPPVDRSDDEERLRLRGIYDHPTPDSEALVDRMFGPHAPLPNKLSAIGLDPKAASAALREQARVAMAAADDLDGEPAEPEVDELFDADELED